MISEETRAESFKDLDIREKQKRVLECLGNKEMTAREVSKEMIKKGYAKTNERNEAAPRLTELFQDRRVVIVAKKKDEETGKNVSVYKRTSALEKTEEDNMKHIPRID